ncbi:hypothetical protein Kfla_5674 [Kribbella flavida DSM 17836]|uniref:Uncharacterized protein n=1 Tax=Kribbella flavida (strain DSM 17836 / JCM 10339 / NBRC 14399) TaxID=479435 RepID=D2PP84_KRIFD|nr:hypothetical protein [Kribbella flavida]ADB34680.1 hypothetical protein Kfla_5674 [Kribbella flavida DSM 17836]
MSGTPATGMLEDMDLFQIISAVVIVGGVVVTALIAIVPSVVDR